MTRASSDHSWSDWGKAFFRVDTMADCSVISVGGEVDMHTAAGLEQALQHAMQTSACLVVDLTQVTFIDSSGLGVLIGARRRATAAGGSLSLVRPPAIVRKLLAGTHLQQILPVHESLDDALAALHAT
jgi:anti-sigma B factor antagonist